MLHKISQTEKDNCKFSLICKICTSKKKKNDANVKQEDWLGVKTSRRWESRRRGKRRGRYD
jgi:hypothetical protein